MNSGGVLTTPWINPHKGTIAALPISNNIGYSWSTYITNNNPATDPYRVTVIVNWTSAAYPSKANNLVRIQTLFASPSGCVSSSTHPFAAPCQPFFYGLAQVPPGQVSISGSVQGLTFTSGYLQLTGTESNLQNEQVTRGRATYTESQVSVTDGLGTRTEGGLLTSVGAADSDPNAPAATYGSATNPPAWVEPSPRSWGVRRSASSPRPATPRLRRWRSPPAGRTSALPFPIPPRPTCSRAWAVGSSKAAR